MKGRILVRNHNTPGRLPVAGWIDMRIYMQTLYSPEQPLRFYHLHLQADLLGGWTLIRESGLQGGRGRVSTEHFDSRSQAEQSLIQRRDMQLRRGYKVVFREGLTQGD